MTDEIIEALGKFIATKILKQPDYAIAPDEPLLTSGLVDSISLMDIVLFAEDTYGVRIEDTELVPDKINTLKQLAALIHSREAS